MNTSNAPRSRNRGASTAIKHSGTTKSSCHEAGISCPAPIPASVAICQVIHSNAPLPRKYDAFAARSVGLPETLERSRKCLISKQKRQNAAPAAVEGSQIRSHRGAVDHQAQTDHQTREQDHDKRCARAKQLNGNDLGSAAEHDHRHGQRGNRRGAGSDGADAADDAEGNDTDQHRRDIACAFDKCGPGQVLAHGWPNKGPAAKTLQARARRRDYSASGWLTLGFSRRRPDASTASGAPESTIRQTRTWATAASAQLARHPAGLVCAKPASMIKS